MTAGTAGEERMLRVAVVGCGGRGRGHLRCLRGFPDVRLTAVCDPVAAARERAQQEAEVPRGYASVPALLDAERLDAVVVATPAHLNAAAALSCLERGMHTLLEKPPGLSVAETTALRDAAARSGAKAMVGWNRRFHPLIVRARQAVEARGPTLQLVGEFHKSIRRLHQSGMFPEHLMDCLLLETPIHSLDVVRALAGAEITGVHAYTRRATSPYRDIHAALVGFANGCVAQLIHNYTTDARLERYEIHGDGISVYLEGVDRAIVCCDGGQEEWVGAIGGGLAEQNRYFLDRVRDDLPIELPAANLDEAIKTMGLAEAMLAAPSPAE